MVSLEAVCGPVGFLGIVFVVSFRADRLGRIKVAEKEGK